METVKIPFKIRLSEGLFAGEVFGTALQDNSLYEVRLSDGTSFFIQAVPDKELRRYNWMSYIQETLAKLVPAIGKFIERDFAKRSAGFVLQ